MRQQQLGQARPTKKIILRVSGSTHDAFKDKDGSVTNDARLASLTESEVVAEVRTDGRLHARLKPMDACQHTTDPVQSWGLEEPLQRAADLMERSQRR